MAYCNFALTNISSDDGEMSFELAEIFRNELIQITMNVISAEKQWFSNKPGRTISMYNEA